MTKLFLAASVAVLAISAPASARPGGHADRQGAAQAQNSAPRADRSAQRAQRVDRGAQRMSMPDRPARMERQQVRANRMERAQPRMAERQQSRANRMERAQPRMAERQQFRAQRMERAQPRMAERHAMRANRIEHAQPRMAERQLMRANRNDRQAMRANRNDRQAMRANRIDRAQSFDRAQPRLAERQAMRNDRGAQFQDRRAQFQDRIAMTQGLREQRFDRRFDHRIDRNAFDSRFANSNGLAFLPPGQAKKLIGMPIASAATYAGYSTFNSFPQSVSYLYPDTNDYYYRYGDGYAYRVDRGSNLISALLPLLGGGYYPGQYLPNNYRSSYVPDYYGFNNFYQDTSYNCNRYVDGMVYQIDCSTGLIEDVVPLYAGGYGVGQMLPSAYYNVPNDYRGLYSDTSDYGYYYAPGAIYQYDQGSSLITSVAALLSPGFGIGQQLPMGYGAYNVPYGYRDNYYDTADNWYRYNNGNIYRVDPTSQLVTAIVASILT